MEENISLPVAEGVKDVALIDFKNILIWNHQNAPINFFFFTSKIYLWAERLKIFLVRSVFDSLVTLNHNTRDHDFFPNKMPVL